MLTITYFLWGRYTAKHVNTLSRRIDENLGVPHRHLCITDKPEGINDNVTTYPLWDEFYGHKYHFYRLKLFAPFAERFGNKIVNIDLDCAVVGSLDSLFTDYENIDFKIWSEKWRQPCHHCGAFWMVAPGRFPRVWDRLIKDYNELKNGNHRFTDQQYLYNCFPDARTWTSQDGIYNFKGEFIKRERETPRENAKLIFFNGGRYDPFHKRIRRKYKWLEDAVK